MMGGKKMKNILVTTSSFRANSFPEGYQVIYNPYKRKLTEEELIGLFREYDPEGMIAGVEPITAKALEAAPSLRVISRCGVGIDSIDVDAVQARHIELRVTAEAPTVSVAELTITLILNLMKKVNLLDRSMRAGGWKGPQGALLEGKRVGIIGCGRIGSRVAKLVRAFDAEPLGCDALVKTHPIMQMVSLDELLQNCDIITLHAPMCPENFHMIGKRQFGMMKKGAYLLNVARGGLVDEAALLEALQDGTLSGAALDCFETEPYSGPLTQMDSVILSPHMGTSAAECRLKMENDAILNLLNAL